MKDDNTATQSFIPKVDIKLKLFSGKVIYVGIPYTQLYELYALIIFLLMVSDYFVG